MAGLYSVNHTWNQQDVLNYSDLDLEFANVKNNMISTVVEGYSSINNVYNSTRAIAEIDPAPSNSTANCIDNQTVAGEIEKLRYVVHRLIDGAATGTNYTTAPTNNVNSIIQNNLAKMVAWSLPCNGSTVFRAWQDCVGRGAIPYSQNFIGALDFDWQNSAPGLISGVAPTGSKSNISIATTGGSVLVMPGTPGCHDEGVFGTNFYNFSQNCGFLCNPLLGISFGTDNSGYFNASLRLPNAIGPGVTGKQTLQASGTTPGNLAAWHYAQMKYKFNSGSSTDLVGIKFDGVSAGNLTGV